MSLGSAGKGIVLLAVDPDDFVLIENARQVLEQGQVHPESPVLLPRPGEWDGTRCKVYGTVLVDPEDGFFKMWYSGTTDTPDAIRRNSGARRMLGFAVSEDGVHWERPVLGLHEYAGSPENNIINPDGQEPVVFLREPGAPGGRFVMFVEAGMGTHRKMVRESDDGIHWREVERAPLESAAWSGKALSEAASVLYDPLDPDPARRYKAYLMTHVFDQGYRGRAICLFLGSSLEAWEDKGLLLTAFDGVESEIHLAHVSRFHDTYVLLYDAMEPNHHTETELAVSKDGLSFRRVQNGVKVLPNGRPGSVDAGMICVSPRSLFEHDGWIWWYYTVSPDTYQGPRGLRAKSWTRYTALARWRADGFASLRPDPARVPGRVLSRPFTLTGEEVGGWINAVAPGDGLGVELVDRDGKVLATARPWYGDELRGPIAWQEAPVLEPGTEAMLRLELRHPTSRVYGVGIQGVAGTQGERPRVSVNTRQSDPRIRWAFQASGKLSAAPLVTGGTVYAGSWDGRLHALDAGDGSSRWTFQAGNAIVACPSIDGDRLFFGARDYRFYALTASGGKELWQHDLDASGRKWADANGPWFDASSAVGAWTCPPEGETEPPRWLYVGAHDRQMHAFDLETGMEMWRFPTFNWILSRPAVDGYVVYFSSLDGCIYAVDARCGALHWRFQVGTRVAYNPAIVPGSPAVEAACGSPLVQDGIVYVGADDGFLYALDAASGQERFAFQTGKWIWGSPLRTGDTLVLASADGYAYGLDAFSGKERWRRPIGLASYTDVIGYDGLALVTSTDGTLTALDPTGGKVAWTFEAGSAIRGAPAVDPDTETIYLPTVGGTLCALDGRARA